MTECRIVLTAPHAIDAGSRVHTPPAGQIVGGIQLGEHDRVVAQRRSDYPVTALGEDFDQTLQAMRVQHRARCGISVH